MKLFDPLATLPALMTLALLGCSAQGNPDAVQPYSGEIIELRNWELKVKDPASPSEESWISISAPQHYWLMEGLPPKGTRVYRTRIDIREQDRQDALGIVLLGTIIASEVRWDGEFIGANGAVAGKETSEVPGNFAYLALVPDSLTHKGVHELQITVSNHQAFTGGIGNVTFGEQDNLTASTTVELAILVFLAGIFNVAALFYLTQFFSRFRRAYGYFSLFCAACVANILPKLLGPFFGLNLGHFNGIVLLDLATWLIMLLSLLMFFFSEFSTLTPRKHLTSFLVVGGPTALLAASIFEWLPLSWTPFLIMLNRILGLGSVLVSLAVCVQAYRRKATGSREALFGLSLLFLGVLASITLGVSYGWSLGLAGMIFCINLSLNRQWQKSVKHYQENQLRSARLEIELLKKNIQPRFLLNSLNAITDWLESDPKTAVRLVDTLAKELRMMLKISQENRITLGEELELCQFHLQLMSLREHRQFQLEASNLDMETRIPPMIFYTLIEEALNSASREGSALHFKLTQKGGRSGQNFVLSWKGRCTQIERFDSEAAALPYVRARLSEAYPDGWNLETRSTGDLTEVELQIEAEALTGVDAQLH